MSRIAMRLAVVVTVVGMLNGVAVAEPGATSTGNAAAPAQMAAPPPSQPPATSVPSATTASPVAQPEEDTAMYQSGYSDGCASANLRYAREAHVKPNRDAALYDSDKEYHDGWTHGYRKCEDRVSPGAIGIPGNSVIM